MRKKTNLNKKNVLILLLVNFVYASESIVSKYASQKTLFDIDFFLGLSLILIIMGTYAILWQQVLKRIELTTAYMFKGTSLIFVLLFSALLFNETITLWNVVGATLIVGGIVWFARV